MKKQFFFLMFSYFAFLQHGNCQIETNSVIIVHSKSPKQIYDFMFSLTQEKYLQWHPEHKEFKIVKVTPDTIGSIFYFDEVIDGFKVDFNWKVIAIESDKKILMKTSKYGVTIIFELLLKEEGGNTQVTHNLKIGNRLTKGIVKKFFFTEKVIKDIDRHAKEEFTNLEWLIP